MIVTMLQANYRVRHSCSGVPKIEVPVYSIVNRMQHRDIKLELVEK